MDAHPVGDVDRLVRTVDPDMNVQTEQQLLTGDEAQRRHEVAVAVASDDPLVLPHRERVGARRADPQPALTRDLDHLRTQRPQLPRRFGHVHTRIGADLEHRLHQLRFDLAVGSVLKQALDRVDEVIALGIDDHQLLLDAQRVAGTVEAVLHEAAAYPRRGRTE